VDTIGSRPLGSATSGLAPASDCAEIGSEIDAQTDAQTDAEIDVVTFRRADVSQGMEIGRRGKRQRDWMKCRTPPADGNLGAHRYVEPDTEAEEEMRPM
jgi:hypothetical protein